MTQVRRITFDFDEWKRLEDAMLTDDECDAVLDAIGHMLRSSGACYPGLEKRRLLESAQNKLVWSPWRAREP